MLPAAFLLSLLITTSLARTEYPLDQFPIYTQATSRIGRCVSSNSASFSTSYGCPTGTPGPCLCTDALQSSKVLLAISSCVTYESLDQQSSATLLWQDYCKTNGGVSIIHPETKLQDIPLFTQVTAYVASCAIRQTASFSVTYGCSDYTLAPCLCGNEASSERIWASMSSCMTYQSNDQIASGSMLWSSFCNVNLQTPASRVVGAPITVSATPTPTTDQYGYPITTSATPGSSSDPFEPTPTSNPASGGGSSSSSSSSSGGSSLNWGAIGAVIGVCSIVVAIGIAWWTNRKNQWIVHTIARMGINQHHQQQQYQQQHMYRRNIGDDMYGGQQRYYK